MKALLLLTLLALSLSAQTTGTASRTNDNTFQAGKTQTFLGIVDMGGGTRTAPCRTGSGAPTGQNGTRGDCYYNTAATAGQNLWWATTTGTPATWTQSPTAPLHSFSFTFDGGASTPAAQDNGFYPEAFYSCTISRASISSKGGTVGSASVDIWAKANANPTVTDKISASAPVALSSSANAQNVSLSGWTTAITSGMRVGAYLSSAATVTGVIVQVWCQ